MLRENEVLYFSGSNKKIIPETEPDIDLSAFQIVKAWGVTSRPVADVKEFTRGRPIRDVLEMNGEWWLLATDNRGKWLVLTDPFGLQPVYFGTAYVKRTPGLFVAEHLTDIGQAMRNCEVKVEPEWSAILPGLASTNDFFDTFYDVSTPLKRVLVTRVNQAILIFEGGYSLIERPDAGLATKSYGDLLDQGINAAVSEISAAADRSETGQIRLNLSGGRDSRLVLSLAVAAGVEDQLVVNTMDPRKTNIDWQKKILTEDLKLSTRIVKRFGISWDDGKRPRSTWPESLDGQLSNFLRYRGLKSNQFNALPYAYRFDNPEVRLTGAGAGALKNPWRETLESLGYWKNFGKIEKSFDADVQQMLRTFWLPIGMDENHKRRALVRFLATMRDLSGGSNHFEDAVAMHYRSFRNRGHVGGLRWSNSMNIVNCNPLLQSAFRFASHQLPADERDKNRLNFDLIEKIDPTLNDLPFQSGPWPWKPSREERFGWERYAADLDSYFEFKDSPQVSATPRFNGFARPELGKMAKAGAREFVQLMESEGLPTSSVMTAIEKVISKGRRGQSALLTKLASVFHALDLAGVFSRSTPSRHPRIHHIWAETDKSSRIL